MLTFKKRTDRILTGVIILVSVTGMIYFGLRAVSDNMEADKENPFEYDVTTYEAAEADLYHYTESQPVQMDMEVLSGLAMDKDDHLYVSGDRSIVKMTNRGTILSTLSTPGTARCMAVDRRDHLYVGMGDHVAVYDEKGVRKAAWESPGKTAMITSIAIADPYVYIADAGNRIVWKYDKSGTRLGRIGDKNQAKDIPGFVIPSPYFDVAVDPDGFLWAANTGRHSLENYTAEGDLRTSWGSYSMNMEGFCGCCNPSHFIILEDGSFVTSEKGIARVKVMNTGGELIAVVAGSDQFVPGTVGLDLAVDSHENIYVLDPKKKMVRVFKKDKE